MKSGRATTNLTAAVLIILSLMVGASTAFEALKIEPYKMLDSYKCGAFMESTINDPAMRLFHSYNNALIRLLSRPFPHEQLLSKAAIQGDLEELRYSFQNKYMTWMDFERNWVGACAGFVLLIAGFTLLYFFYRCCVCCCGVLRKSGDKKAKISETRYGNCQRILLDVIIGVFIIVNLFVSVVLLMSSQYAQYGIEQLPTRLSYCVNDLSVYKFESNDRIRKLLRDDFQTLNDTLVANVNTIGADIMHKFKRSTGADFIEQLTDKLDEVQSLQKQYSNLRMSISRTLVAKQILAQKLAKMRESEFILRKCAGSVLEDVPEPQPRAQVQTEDDIERATMPSAQANKAAQTRPQAQAQTQAEAAMARTCRLTFHLIQPLVDADKTETEYDYINRVLPTEIADALKKVEELNITSTLKPIVDELKRLQKYIQNFVNKNQNEITTRLKELDDTMYRLYDNISSKIKAIDLKRLEEHVDPMMQQRERFKIYLQYTWLGTLIVAGIFLFIACAFLLGLFYGCCGRRPSPYNDDCCVRSTGSKFYGCGTWLSIMFMTFFALVSALLIFIGSNAHHLICHPLEDPLSRPDMLSFLDRVLDAYGFDDPDTLSRYNIPQLFTKDLRPADLILGCQRGETFYAMLNLDKKFKLIADGGPIDEYMELIGVMSNFNSSRFFNMDYRNFYTENFEEKVRFLLETDVPIINASSIQRFRASTSHFAVGAVLHQLEKALAEGGTQELDGNAQLAHNEVTNIVSRLKELRTEAENVTAQVEDNARQLMEMGVALKRLASIKHDGANLSLTERLRAVDATLNERSLNNERLVKATQQSVSELTEIVLQYAQHVNRTMRHEVSSCAPIRQIAQNTRAALCSHTLDPFNGVWMAMTISLLLLIPIIVLSTRLISLYDRVDPLHNLMRQYRATPTTATDSIMNGESDVGYYGCAEPLTSQPKPLHYNMFANDFSNGGNYGSATDDYFGHHHNHHHQPYPPPYCGDGMRR